MVQTLKFGIEKNQVKTTLPDMGLFIHAGINVQLC